MKRILLTRLAQPARETVARLLAKDYEIVRGKDVLDGTALAAAAGEVDLVIAGASPSAEVAELMRLAARGKAAALILADSKTAVSSLPQCKNLEYLVQPFSPYELKAAVGRLLATPQGFGTEPPASSGVAKSYLGYPFISRSTALLANRFAALSLPVLIWGELGCGQDRIARALFGAQGAIGGLLQLNGMDVTADVLKEKRLELGAVQRLDGTPPAVLIEGLERLSTPGQSMLLHFLEELERTYGRLRLLGTATEDLLERVYHGEFLERLYYRVATLTLPLTPLRNRRTDIPALADWFAGKYASELGLEEVLFTPAAIEALRDYLWFGNVNEFETVIARTLAIRGGGPVDAADLVFDISVLQREIEEKKTADTSKSGSHRSLQGRSGSSLGSKASTGGSSGLRLLVHELAHELKNPMVTIKTFAQLLGDRYDDATFRARFRDVVGGDIERMDDLLEVMTEFAGFDHPQKRPIVLEEHLHSTVEAIHPDCAKRQVKLEWKGNGDGGTIEADTFQLHYALKNTLLTVLSQAKAGTEIELESNAQGSLTISYHREGERIHSLAHYLSHGVVLDGEGILPLRILLAREIVERNGGRIGLDQKDGDREIVTVEFPPV